MIKYILYLIPCKMWYSCSSLIVHSLYFSSFAISFTHRNRTWHKSFTHLRTAKYSTRRPTRQKGPFFTSWFRKISSDFFLKNMFIASIWSTWSLELWECTHFRWASLSFTPFPCVCLPFPTLLWLFVLWPYERAVFLWKTICLRCSE